MRSKLDAEDTWTIMVQFPHKFPMALSEPLKFYSASFLFIKQEI